MYKTSAETEDFSWVAGWRVDHGLPPGFFNLILSASWRDCACSSAALSLPLPSSWVVAGLWALSVSQQQKKLQTVQSSLMGWHRRCYTTHVWAPNASACLWWSLSHTGSEMQSEAGYGLGCRHGLNMACCSGSSQEGVGTTGAWKRGLVRWEPLCHSCNNVFKHGTCWFTEIETVCGKGLAFTSILTQKVLWK